MVNIGYLKTFIKEHRRTTTLYYTKIPRERDFDFIPNINLLVLAQLTETNITYPYATFSKERELSISHPAHSSWGTKRHIAEYLVYFTCVF